jgi:antitoxin component YwqK of YwqJK toxin-antitoxin module
MNYLKSASLAFLCILQFTVSAQQNTLNQLDSGGRKTGVWETYYESGKVKSHGTFRDGHPVGLLLKYYPGGILQAEMNFDETGTVSRVKMYYETSGLASEGKYVNQLRDSVWNYYSSWDKRKAFSESWKMGKRDGVTYKFYSEGKPSEYLEWKDNVKNGKWEQYFENGAVRLTGYYLNDTLNGNFVCYNPDSSLSIKGSYRMGTLDGTWTYYSEDGKEDFTVQYRDGAMMPNPEMDKRIDEFSKKVKESMGNIKEPEIPEAY